MSNPAMSKRRTNLLPQLEKYKEMEIVKDLSIEQEIECPRCHDIMTLHSEFDRLGYLYDECNFSLHLSH
ncbi:MAG: hypothetical protein WAM14_07225 [Candidatus Nitrosopolaris sp.]